MVVGEFWINMPHVVGHGAGNRRKHRGFHAQFPAKQHPAPDQTPEDVAPPRVAGNNAVADKERRRPCVFGDDPYRTIGGFVLSPFLTRQLLDPGDDGLKDVSFIDVRSALQDCQHPLEAHPCIDVFGGQDGIVAVEVAVVLGEYEVVQLDEIVVVVRAPHPVAHRVVYCRNVVERSAVVANFGTGPTYALVAGRTPPVVLVAKPVDTLRRNSQVEPDLFGLVIGGVDGVVQAFRIETEAIRHQIERPFTGFFFEIVPETEVAQHLEHGEVGIVAYLFDIGGPEALLRGCYARVRRLFLSREVGLELRHPCTDEQQRGIGSWNQRGRRHAQVVAFLEIRQKRFSQFVSRLRHRC